MVCLLFFNGQLFSSKVSSQDIARICFFIREKKKKSQNNNPNGPILILKYRISFNLFLSDCIPLTLLVIKLRLLFGSFRSSSVQITIISNQIIKLLLYHVILMRIIKVFSLQSYNKIFVIHKRNCEISKYIFKFKNTYY